MLRKTAIDFENTEDLNSPILQKKNRKCCYILLPITHALSIGLGIVIGLRIHWLNDCDGSL